MKLRILRHTLALLAISACTQTLPVVDSEGNSVKGDTDVFEDPDPNFEPMFEVKLEPVAGSNVKGRVLFRTFNNSEFLWAMLSLNACESGKHYVVSLESGTSCASDAAIGTSLAVLNGVNAECGSIPPSALATNREAAPQSAWTIYGPRAISVIDRAITVREDAGGGIGGASGAIVACGAAPPWQP